MGSPLRLGIGYRYIRYLLDNIGIIYPIHIDAPIGNTGTINTWLLRYRCNRSYGAEIPVQSIIWGGDTGAIDHIGRKYQ